MMFKGTIVIPYFFTNSCDKSQVLSAKILIIFIYPITFAYANTAFFTH